MTPEERRKKSSSNTKIISWSCSGHFLEKIGHLVGPPSVEYPSSLYVNHQKLQQYIANDTKYRSLKLIKNKGLEALLYAHDSTYLADPDMRKQVLEQEAARDRKLELLREAREKRREAGELEKKAGQAGR